MAVLLDETTRKQTAREVCLLLNEAIGELVIPLRLHALTENLPEGPVDIQYLSVRHAVLQGTIIAVYRLKETRSGFIEGWLMTDAELRALGFAPVEEFIGVDKWSHFETVRHQYAGHASASKASKSQPARLIAPAILGKAMRETGLKNLKAFLLRVVEQLAPGVERVRDEITKRYPEAETFDPVELGLVASSGTAGWECHWSVFDEQ
jgi:hypothetical protein